MKAGLFYFSDCRERRRSGGNGAATTITASGIPGRRVTPVATGPARTVTTTVPAGARAAGCVAAVSAQPVDTGIAGHLPVVRSS